MNSEPSFIDPQSSIAKKIVYEMLSKKLEINFYSQATQDIFVLRMLTQKRGGFYLEIGGGHPSESNNTFLLEKEFLWTGISVELNDNLVNLYNLTRVNKVIKADATNFDWEKYLHLRNAPRQIDYLSIDIDPAHNSYKALENLPLNTYRFSVITFEHDKYQSGDEFMEKSRYLLNNLGYELVVSNVSVFGRDFEDWWIDPRRIPKEVWKVVQNKNIEFARLWN